MSDPADLSNLRDIVLPPEVALWPPAPGWWIVGAALIVVAAILGVAAVAHYRRNLYRRAALAELHRAAPQDISSILKRAALVAWPRRDVASLTGAGWLSFLDRTGHTDAFSRGGGRDIETLAYGGGGDVPAARAAARDWLRRHRC
jgi:hypothetical protein